LVLDLGGSPGSVSAVNLGKRAFAVSNNSAYGVMLENIFPRHRDCRGKVHGAANVGRVDILIVHCFGCRYAYDTAVESRFDRVGCFKSRVIGIGPQIGYLFPVGNMQGYLNLKGYREFDQQNRPAGWNAWLTFSISPAAPPAATPPPSRSPMIYK
jgi:hypothetical protein